MWMIEIKKKKEKIKERMKRKLTLEDKCCTTNKEEEYVEFWWGSHCCGLKNTWIGSSDIYSIRRG